jgi:hypothetical protein
MAFTELDGAVERPAHAESECEGVAVVLDGVKEDLAANCKRTQINTDYQ